jgi:formylglycine-generating enzyme required for sulfatase activity
VADVTQVRVSFRFVTGLWFSACAPASSHSQPSCGPAAQASGASQRETTKAETLPAARPGMVLVPGTEFFMGHVRQGDDDGMEPGHMERVETFFIDTLETTVAEYLECVRAARCPLPSLNHRDCNLNARRRLLRLDHPINCVTDYDADGYCTFRNKRVPTLAEWELAARGTDRRIYPWGNEAPAEQLCWQGRAGNANSATCPVGSFPTGKSFFGALDMAGNVSEWTDTTGSDYQRLTNFLGGGSYRKEPLETPDWLSVRLDAGGDFRRDSASPEIGIRCAQSIKHFYQSASEAAQPAVPLTRQLKRRSTVYP